MLSSLRLPRVALTVGATAALALGLVAVTGASAPTRPVAPTTR